MGKESVTKTRVRLLKAPPSVNLLVLKVQRGSQYILRGLFPFRKRSLPFFTVDVTFGNQAFSHDGCNVFPGLSYNKANDTFLNRLRKNEVEAQVEFTLKILERARVTSTSFPGFSPTRPTERERESSVGWVGENPGNEVGVTCY